MVVRTHRVIALMLACDLLALTGCGQAPVNVPTTVAAVTRHAPAAARGVSVERIETTADARPVAVDRIETTADPVVLPKPAEIFSRDYREGAENARPSDPTTAAEVRAELSAGGMSWAKVGGAIGAGLLGTTFLGYFVYAGMVGSHDLMYPTKTTFEKDPSAYGVPYERVLFHSHDGLKLVGWYVPAAVPTTKGLVLFHGHSSNKDTMYRKYGSWLHSKYNLFLYDSRYHGESEGKFTTLGYFERRDAQIAIDQLRAHGNSSVGLLGESMGGAVAIDAAAADQGVKAVWSDCPFDSLQDAIAPRAKKRKYPMASAVGFAVVQTVRIRAHAPVAEADPIKFVDRIAPRPLYLVHGQADDDTTPMNSEKLFEKAQEPKAIWRTEGAHHAESVDKYPEEYKARAMAFFDQAL